MAAWSQDDLRKIGETDDLHISPFREVFFVLAQNCARRSTKRKIDRLMSIVAETEQIADRRNFSLKSRARISDGSGARCPSPHRKNLHWKFNALGVPFKGESDTQGYHLRQSCAFIRPTSNARGDCCRDGRKWSRLRGGWGNGIIDSCVCYGD